MARPFDLAVVCDGLRLCAGAFVPDEPRGVVVLLHGIPSTAPPEPGDRGYEGFAETLATEGWAAVWGDMRAARGAAGYFSLEGWVRDARALVDAARTVEGVAGLPVAVVGSSAGGVVAVEAVRRGAPVDALVLMGTPAAWVSFAADAQDALRRITVEAGMPVSPEVLAEPQPWVGEFESITTEAAIAHVRTPVLVLHGTADDVVPVGHAERIAARAPRAEVRILDGAGHQLRRDERAVRIALDWLARTMPGARA